MPTERRKASEDAHSAKLERMVGKAEKSDRKYTDEVMEKHHKTAAHVKPAEIAAIADKEAAKIVGKSVKPRMDRAARKKGGRTKGDVNIIIAQKPDAAPGGMPMGAMPPRPMMPPPPAPPMAPPPGMGAPPPAMAGGPPPGMPPQMPGRKKGGKVVKLTDGSGGGLGRLEKAAEYGARS